MSTCSHWHKMGEHHTQSFLNQQQESVCRFGAEPNLRELGFFSSFQTQFISNFPSESLIHIDKNNNKKKPQHTLLEE